MRPSHSIHMLMLAAMGVLLTHESRGADALEARFPWERQRDGKEPLRWAQGTLAPLPVPRETKAPKNRYFKLSGKGRYVAFTFDDGPRPWTNDVLDALKERGLRGTFYVVGSEALRYPQIIKRMVDEGHELGNHTMTHAYLSGRRKPPQETIEREIRMGHDTIVKLGGVVPKTIRPPGGLFSQEQTKWVYEAFGYVDVRWSVDPGDADPRRPRPDTPTFRRRVLSQVHDGAIILSHDLHQSTAAAIPSTLDALLERGYEFLTVSELLALDDPYENVRLTDQDLEDLERSIILPESPAGR